MKYTLAIDMLCFSTTHFGGKDETTFNLLKGFEKNGVSKNIICLCANEMVSVIKQYAPNIHLHIVPQLYFGKFKIKGMNRANRIIHSLYVKCWIEKNKKNVKVFLFPNKPTTLWKYCIPTVLIPHDIQVFEADKLPGVCYTEKEYKKDTSSIVRDFKNRDYIIAISDFDKAEMIKFMPWATHKIKRIYDPICFDKMGKEYSYGDEYLTVLNIQWLHKNVETVIRAYALIANQITYTLVLVGRKPKDVDRLNMIVNELGLENRITFTGFVNTKKLDEIVRKTRIYINASYFEGFGMTAVEMMGRGIPTIVAKNTAQPEVTRGLCCYYEPSDSHTALADAIMHELKNPTSQEKLKLIADEMRKYYSYESIAKEYWQFIEKCERKQENVPEKVNV